MRVWLALMLLGIAVPVSAAAQAADMVAGSVPNISLSTITFGPEMMRDQVVKRWGDGYPTMSSFMRYRIDTGEMLELLFSPIEPYPLVSARLLDGKTEGGRLLFDDNLRARSRRIGQIAKCPNSVAYLREVWGPADYEYGSGIGRYVYELADGSSVTVSNISRSC